MQRLWVRWTAMAVFATVMITAFVLLGRWQLARLEWRKHNNDVVRQHESAPVVAFPDSFTGPVTDADQWQRVEVTGSYDNEHQVQIRYRNLGDERGYEIVTPLRADDGRSVLVDRGFVAVPQGQAIPTSLPQAPAGKVTVVGFVRRNEQGRASAVNPVGGSARLVNAPAIGATLPYPVVDGWLALQTSSTSQEGGLQALGLPQLDEGPHLSYALQWFSFTLIAVVGLVILIRGDVRERRELRRLAGSGGAEDGAGDEAGTDRAGTDRAGTDKEDHHGSRTG